MSPEERQGEPGFQEVLDALKRALENNRRLGDFPAEEVARQLMVGGYLREEPDLSVVTDALASLGAKEQAFGPDVPTEDA
jgi:hypothetical protein